MSDVLAHGYWHARNIAYTGSEMAQFLEWLRLPGDLIFILFGAVLWCWRWELASPWRDVGRPSRPGHARLDRNFAESLIDFIEICLRNSVDFSPMQQCTRIFLSSRRSVFCISHAVKQHERLQ